MSNKEKYYKICAKSFCIPRHKIKDSLEYNSIPQWDSIGHMGLMANVEDAFNISLDTDDIINFGTIKKGMTILKKYGVKF